MRACSSPPAWLALPAALAGCTERQSALAPAGSDASLVAELSGVMFAGAAVILLIVVVALALAIGGPARWRRGLAGDGAIRIGGIVFPTLTLTALLVYGIWVMRETSAPATAAAVTVEVTAEQWWWRIGYRARSGATIAEANEIRIPVGREVEFVLRSADVIHSFWVPSLGGKLDMIPGRTNRLRLNAQRPGVYRGQCAEYCGGAHALMALEIVAMPQEAFDAWLATAEGVRPEPAGDSERRGRDLFIAAGCGSCHAVRGTVAAGAIGPDLSRVGERRSIAAATLPGGRESIARFVTDGQSIKPGNAMPPFAIFSATELEDLSAYLASLT